MVLLLRLALVLAALGLWIYAIADVLRSDPDRVNHLHKMLWLVVVLLVPPAAVIWLTLGRPSSLGTRLGRPSPVPVPPPDDAPEYLAQLDLEIRRRRRVDRLRRREPDLDDAKVEDEIRRFEEDFGTDEDGRPAG